MIYKYIQVFFYIKGSILENVTFKTMAQKIIKLKVLTKENN